MGVILRPAVEGIELQAAPTAEQFIARKQERIRNRQATMRTKDIGRGGRHEWELEAATFRVQSNLPQKVFAVERWRYKRFISTGGRPAYADREPGTGGAQAGSVEYRIGYYIVGKIGRARERWAWGQFAPLIPAQDPVPLLTQAKEEGTILP